MTQHLNQTFPVRWINRNCFIFLAPKVLGAYSDRSLPVGRLEEEINLLDDMILQIMSDAALIKERQDNLKRAKGRSFKNKKRKLEPNHLPLLNTWIHEVFNVEFPNRQPHELFCRVKHMIFHQEETN